MAALFRRPKIVYRSLAWMVDGRHLVALQGNLPLNQSNLISNSLALFGIVESRIR